MSRYIGEPKYTHGSPESLGVLLANLGTPEAPTASAVRRYLAEFLWDPRVIELPRPLWWLLLHGVILRIRPPRTAEAYAKVWTDDGSPLLSISRRQQRAVAARLEQRFTGPVHVSLGMRYGRPSIGEAIDELNASGARRLLVLPLYPQYSATTTASVFDAVADRLKRTRWLPELRLISQYHDEPGYIAALAASIREHWERAGRGDKLLFSFHGLPRRYLLAGDPYHCQCHKTARLVAEALGLAADEWTLSFQSRVGREEWLKPYTDELITELAGRGIKRLDVVCPAFSADCLETLEEIAMQNAEIFQASGGKTLSYIPALNDREDHMDFIADLIQRHCRGWPETDAAFDPERVRAAAAASRERALALGACC